MIRSLPYLPAFADIKVLRALDAVPDDVVDLDRPITIRHILQHSAGLGLGLGIGLTGEAMLAEIDVYNPSHSLADDVNNVAKVPLVYQPGTIWNYSLAPDIQARLGRDIERRTLCRLHPEAHFRSARNGRHQLCGSR
jgi:hypothetical protein